MIEPKVEHISVYSYQAITQCVYIRHEDGIEELNEIPNGYSYEQYREFLANEQDIEYTPLALLPFRTCEI